MDDIKERVNHNNATATIFEMLNGNEIANKFGIYASMHACKLLHHMLIYINAQFNVSQWQLQSTKRT